MFVSKPRFYVFYQINSAGYNIVHNVEQNL